MEEPSEDDFQDRVIIVEERFLKMFSPLESYIMRVQGLLVWENYQHSAAMFALIHILFW